MIIDCHTHLNRYEHDHPPSPAARLATLRETMDANGIAHALVLTSYTVNENRPSTDEVLELLDGDPRFSVVAGVDFHELGKRQLRYLEGLLAEERIRAIKLYPGYQRFDVRSKRLRPLYGLAGECGVPVMVHTGDTFAHTAKVRFTHPLVFDELAVDCRVTSFVLCHMGNPWFVDAMEVVYKNENLFGDISGLTLGAFQPRYEKLVLGKLNDAIAFINDPGKLMFGTDWPISDTASYLDFTRKLDTTPEELEGLLWRNAARLFRIAPAVPEERPRVLAE